MVQRLWTALLLVVAFEGARRLWLALRPEASPWTAWVAGVAFAVSPRLLGLVGVLSAEVLPTVVLPWVVLPLVMAQQGRIGLRAGALWSGVALLFTGGVNAVENLAALPLPLFVVLAALGRPGGGRLVRWWLGAVAVASAWWMLPLLVLGRYSPPFLDYIETSAAVVRPLGWTNVARGADHWVSFVFVGGDPWWPGSYELSTDALLIAVTGVVAAAGLWGLTRPHMPLQRPLLWSLLLGMLCLTIARSGPLASPVQEQFQVLLDGPLSMLRNVHKVDPLVRLPLALGLAQLTTAFWPAAGRRWAGARTISQALVVIVLLVSAQPLWTGELRKPGWDAVPQAWGEAAAYLAAQEGTGSTLVLPGSGFGQQGWGWTIDEPIQGLASTPWAARSQVPLTPGGTIRNLDAIQERIADGQGSPYLADLLARAGVEYVLVRRDLDLFASGAPDPARVDLAVSRSPGLEPAASFGRTGFGEQPMIDVYRVDREVSRVHAVDLDDVTTLAGGPEDVLTALESGALDPESPVVIAGEEHWPTVSPDVVADGYRKRERSFGRLEDALSEVMARDEPYRLVRSAHDYPGVAAAERVYARYDGVVSVTASTSGGYADTLGPVRPELGPYAAVDGLSETYWQSSTFTDPVGQWVEVRLAQPTPLDRMSVQVGVDGFTGLPVRRVRVSAGGQVRDAVVDPATGLVDIGLDGRPVDRVRVTVTGVAGTDGVVTVREISLPGVDIDRQLVVPEPGGRDTTFVLRARPPRRGCIDAGLGVGCGYVTDARVGEEESGMVRDIAVTEDGSWDFEGEVVARSTRETQRLLEPILENTRVTGTSTYRDAPNLGAQLAFDGDPVSFWAASPGDPRPTLRLRWPHRRVLSSLGVVAPTGTAVAPTGAQLTGNGGQSRVVDLTAWQGDVRADADQTARDQVRRTDHRGLRSGRGGGAGDREPGGPGAPDRPRSHDRCGVRAGTGARGRRADVPDRGDGDHRCGAGRHPAHGHRLRSAGPLVRGQPPGTRHRHRPVHGHPAHAAALDSRLVGGDEHGGRDPARRRRAQLDDQPAGPRRGVRPGGPPGAAGERQHGLAGHARWTRADAPARRRLDAGLPAPGRRRRPGDARVHSQPSLPGRSLDRWPAGSPARGGGSGGGATREAFFSSAGRRPAGHDQHGPPTPLGVALASAHPAGRCPPGRAGLRGRTCRRRPGAAPGR